MFVSWPTHAPSVGGLTVSDEFTISFPFSSCCPHRLAIIGGARHILRGKINCCASNLKISSNVLHGNIYSIERNTESDRDCGACFLYLYFFICKARLYWGKRCYAHKRLYFFIFLLCAKAPNTRYFASCCCALSAFSMTARKVVDVGDIAPSASFFNACYFSTRSFSMLGRHSAVSLLRLLWPREKSLNKPLGLNRVNADFIVG